MNTLIRNLRRFDALDADIARWMRATGPVLMRYSIAVVFFWFGLLKVLGISPAQDLVENTVYWFSNPADFVVVLGAWEMLIGLTLCVPALTRLALLLLFLQMPGTFLPLVLLPDVCFTQFPLGLTMEGQYIIKNLVLISAALVVGGTVRHAAWPTRLQLPARVDVDRAL